MHEDDRGERRVQEAAAPIWSFMCTRTSPSSGVRPQASPRARGRIGDQCRDPVSLGAREPRHATAALAVQLQLPHRRARLGEDKSKWQRLLRLQQCIRIVVGQMNAKACEASDAATAGVPPSGALQLLHVLWVCVRGIGNTGAASAARLRPPRARRASSARLTADCARRGSQWQSGTQSERRRPEPRLRCSALVVVPFLMGIPEVGSAPWRPTARSTTAVAPDVPQNG